MQEQYEPVIRAMPRSMRAKLQPPEYYHEVLEHKWFLSQKAGRDVSMDEAVRDYILTQLPNRRDEKALIASETSAIPVIEP